jgi:hypothetical protein
MISERAFLNRTAVTGISHGHRYLLGGALERDFPPPLDSGQMWITDFVKIEASFAPGLVA